MPTFVKRMFTSFPHAGQAQFHRTGICEPDAVLPCPCIVYFTAKNHSPQGNTPFSCLISSVFPHMFQWPKLLKVLTYDCSVQHDCHAILGLWLTLLWLEYYAQACHLSDYGSHLQFLSPQVLLAAPCLNIVASYILFSCMIIYKKTTRVVELFLYSWKC